MSLISEMIKELQDVKKLLMQHHPFDAPKIQRVILSLESMETSLVNETGANQMKEAMRDGLDRINHIPTNREEILLEAIKCVTKDRNATHGDPEDNFKTIAAFWNAYLNSNLSPGQDLLELTATDVATMMILMKISRTVTSPEHKDHWVDIAGYAACGGGIATKNS